MNHRALCNLHTKATLIEISAPYLSTKKSLTEFPVFVSRMFFSKGDWVHFYNSCIFFPINLWSLFVSLFFSNPRTSWSYFWVTWKNAKTNMGEKNKKIVVLRKLSRICKIKGQSLHPCAYLLWRNVMNERNFMPQLSPNSSPSSKEIR